MSRFRRFGQGIFRVYEDHQMKCNMFIGASMFMLGEIIATKDDKTSFQDLNWTKIRQLGALGVVENGIVMTVWYSYLDRLMRGSVSTSAVIAKCSLDQIFMASQADVSFLGLVAYNDKHNLDAALKEIENNFLVTWLKDTALWPVVNFFAFAFIPVKFQPPFMAAVQLFWQIYLSKAANASSRLISTDPLEGDREKESCDEDALIRSVFSLLDADRSGTINESDLAKLLNELKIGVSPEELKNMLIDADENGDGVISYDELKKIYKIANMASDGQGQGQGQRQGQGLWVRAITESKVRVMGRSQVAMKRYEDLASKVPTSTNSNNLTVNNSTNSTAAVTASSSSMPLITQSVEVTVSARSPEQLDHACGVPGMFDNLDEQTSEALRYTKIGAGTLAFLAIFRKLVFRI